jgi:hypothetical protein
MAAEMQKKGRRGYSKHGYPIVWIRFEKAKIDTKGKTDEEISAEVHANCMAKLLGQEVNSTTLNAISKVKKGFKKNKNSKVNFIITADNYQLHLKYKGRTTYHTDLPGAVESLYKQLVITKVANRGFVKDLATLKEIAIEAKNEVLESVRLHEES